MADHSEKNLFRQIPQTPLIVRLGRELRGAARELAGGPASYLAVVLLPDSLRDWLPSRLARAVGSGALALLVHPVRSVASALTPDTIGLKRRRRFVPILIVSCAVHVALAGYITYVAIRAAYGNLHVVDKSYKKLDLTHLLEKIHYPPNMLRGPAGPPLSLDQIRERARKRQQEMARLEAERKRKEEEEKKAEEARKKAAEEAAAKEAAAKEAAGKTTFGEINVAPIKDVVGKLYDLYQAGQVDLELDKLSITVAFKIDPDGSIPKSSIKVLKSSGSKLVDQDAIEILWMLGESHALGPLSSLSSNTIRLEVTSDIAKLSITSFATTPEDAKGKAFFLGVALGLLKKSQRDKNPAVAELLDHLTLKTDNKRLEADMTVSRARAAEMMRAQFAKSSATPTP